ncbi:MAG TPA: molybdopterin-binding protein [Thermomicrobiaceae bacterium]|nr:molybdopterin-binding protein [Thermomicrobiaceae bacterium]
MRGHKLQAREIVARGLRGWVLAEDVRSTAGKRVARKGQRLDDAVLEQLASADGREVHVVEPEPGEIHEDEASRRLATAVAGPGLRLKGPAQSRFNLIAQRKGVVRIDQDLLRQLNALYGVAVFTLLDRQVVLPGKVVAGVKVTPLVMPEAVVRRAEEIASQGPVIALQPFQPKQVAVVATQGLPEKLRDRFRRTVEQKIGWYGSTISGITYLPAEAEAVAEALRELARTNDVILVAGGNTIDPLDPAFVALDRSGAEMIHFGAPSHPGSMFWLARLGETSIVNLASCSMYSRSTFADLVLPLVMTGERVTEAEIDEFGYGGLLERDMAFRFPPYDSDVSDEENEDA